MPQNIDQVIVVIAFLIPGFIFTRVFGFSIPLRGREAGALVLDSIAASAINYALLSPLVWLLLKEPFSSRHPRLVMLAWFVVLFVSPVVLGLLAARLVEGPRARRLRRALRLIHPVPKAWDYFFRQGKGCWVVAKLKDGGLLAGLYGMNSFASSYPDEEDLFLEKTCTLSADGKISGLVQLSEGVILRMSEVRVIEFFRL